MISVHYKKEISKNITVKRIAVEFINNHKYKWVYHCFTANWQHLKLYPRFWLNKSINTPNFNHWSLLLDFYGGILEYRKNLIKNNLYICKRIG